MEAMAMARQKTRIVIHQKKSRNNRDSFYPNISIYHLIFSIQKKFTTSHLQDWPIHFFLLSPA